MEPRVAAVGLQRGNAVPAVALALDGSDFVLEVNRRAGLGDGCRECVRKRLIARPERVELRIDEVHKELQRAPGVDFLIVGRNEAARLVEHLDRIRADPEVGQHRPEAPPVKRNPPIRVIEPQRRPGVGRAARPLRGVDVVLLQ